MAEKSHDPNLITAEQRVESPKEKPKYVHLTPEESRLLFAVAREVGETKKQQFIGDTNGVIFVLMALVHDYIGLSDQQKQVLAPLKGKIANVYPEWLNRDVPLNWRFIPVERKLKSATEFMDANVMATAGKDPSDPGEGTFMENYYAEDYAHENPRGRSFVLAAYNSLKMRPATEEEGRGRGWNFRNVPLSGNLHDAFRGAVLVELGSQIPDVTTVRELLDSKKNEWIQTALQQCKDKAAALAKDGIGFAADEAVLESKLSDRVDMFVHIYGSDVLGGWRGYDTLSFEEVSARLHRMTERIGPLAGVPFSLQTIPHANIESVAEGISLIPNLGRSITSQCEETVSELFKEYNAK